MIQMAMVCVMSSKSQVARMIWRVITMQKQQTKTDLARMLMTAMTAMATASRTWTATEYAISLKLQVARTA